MSSSQNDCTTRWTMGRGASSNHTTGMSPTSIEDVRFHRNSISPLWKAGAIDSEMTHIIGVDELVTKLRPFHIMKIVLSCRSRGRNSARGWRRPADLGDDIVKVTLSDGILSHLSVRWRTKIEIYTMLSPSLCSMPGGSIHWLNLCGDRRVTVQYKVGNRDPLESLAPR